MKKLLTISLILGALGLQGSTAVVFKSGTSLSKGSIEAEIIRENKPYKISLTGIPTTKKACQFYFDTPQFKHDLLYALNDQGFNATKDDAIDIANTFKQAALAESGFVSPCQK